MAKRFFIIIVDYHRLMYWMQENGVDPATLRKELNLEKDTFARMRRAEDSDQQVLEAICRRLGCSIDDIRYTP